MAQRIVAVFGATGTQGASVVDALLADGTFKPRAITRSSSSDAAQELKNRGAEVVQADLLDVESIKRAVSGCECVFGVTDYTALREKGYRIEEQVGKSLVDAAKEAGVRFFVWSSLPNVTKISGGKYPNVYHFDNKAAVEDYLKASGLPNASVQTGYFAENLWKIHALRKVASGYELSSPIKTASSHTNISWIGHDLGASVLVLFKNYESRQAEVLGQTFYVMSETMTYQDFAQKLENAFGVPVKFVSGPKTGIVELNEMIQADDEFAIYAGAEIPDSRLMKLGVKFGSVQEFAESVKSKYV
ncbi:hypothetical protein SERLA73DRAFT_144748 [Serpula lacrymans var. lacrymans S7.3]|uniref:NmrA-like domain-containing protein n=2 Tax=Serpula lacrymans var. lacrymans TaxID=341189 RepID=F8QCB2_SERL3|nr:uncharacterized protein SERLADRAFT_402416 [Serpula lacrymans var. lacrymans S7.9]EGN94231.1 hypothetical protein SERLA73DRAFT_144748 [Serpula lacrymans var. lacrymans S7.3]EGO19723.1 hypothetical protein SERLADRAFT_402416 [Serpula lacrymans var. lacrymans S7.9]